MPATTHPSHAATPPGALRHVLVHLLTPLLMCLGMGLAYLGAFGDPAPHHMPVAVVAQDAGPRAATGARVLAQTLQDHAAGGLDVRTAPNRADAVRLVEHRQVAGAYVMSRGTPELLVATAASGTDVTVVQKVFTPVADQQGTPLKVTDLVPTAPHDPTGQGLFFLLVAVSIGSYAAVAVIGGTGASLRLRTRALTALGMSAVVSLAGAVLAGPLFHIVDHRLWGVWSLAWLYSAGILLLGTGLHTFLRRWTTLGVMVLFVMLNFTSSGGVLAPDTQNGFFAALHSFWNGAGFLEGARNLVYFDGRGTGRPVVTLACWLVAGLGALLAAGLAERARRAEQRRTALDASAVASAALRAAGPGTPAPGPGHAAARDDLERWNAEEEEEEETVAV
ncbi:hypothetical protein [Streptantibioticus silvisoli]|uniref:ABC transporter permease n=1 Tax=Streptantibioticus silvisoli TaxID=2705255 RepID=A0ABT6VVZ0_9ACTN|nr:hypothetical protein [Streptantibioticus silvisoli]MDI5962656.1 hypothetical protein [Streptantibioticus silvisoli]